MLVGDDRPWAHKMVESVRTHHPGIKITQMSDMDTACIADEVIRRPYDRKMMTFRLDHLANYPHDEMLVLDDDCIVKGDLSHVFDDFDIALTRRTTPAVFEGVNFTETCPYNTGVMFSRSQDFWKRAAQVCHALPERFQQWWGDQMAVAVTAEKGGYRVKELDAAKYNWTPIARCERSDALVWHYKGQRKEWI